MLGQVKEAVRRAAYSPYDPRVGARRPMSGGYVVTDPGAVVGRRPTSLLGGVGWILAAGAVFGVCSLAAAVVLGLPLLPWRELVTTPVPVAFALGWVYEIAGAITAPLLAFFVSRRSPQLSWAVWWVMTSFAVYVVTRTSVTAVLTRGPSGFGVETFWTYDYAAHLWNMSLLVAVAAVFSLLTIALYTAARKRVSPAR